MEGFIDEATGEVVERKTARKPAVKSGANVPEVYKAILAIQSAVGSIPKNGVGPSSKGSFAFIKADDIISSINQLLTINNVIVRESSTLARTVSEGSRTYISAQVDITTDFISVIDGSVFTVSFSGEGSDIGSDTATRKAYTQAQKITLLHTFVISTGDLYDQEGEEPQAPQKASTPTVANHQNDKVGSAISARDEKSLTQARAKVKMLSRKLELESSDINKRGNQIHPDFFNNVDALVQLAKILEDEAA